jgi:hypothetical protein
METGTTSTAPPLTMEGLLGAIEKLRAIPENTRWLVVDPNGQMYEGTVEQVLKFVMERHPLFNKPIIPASYNPDL